MDNATYRLTAKEVEGELDGIFHDFGDEYGWDMVPEVDFLCDELADRTRKDDISYDSKVAREYATKLVARASASSNRRQGW
jgi:hypothetical protein